MTYEASTDAPWVLLGEDPGFRVLSLPTRVRNARAVRRAGGRLGLPANDRESLLHLPSSEVVDPRLLRRLPRVDDAVRFRCAGRRTNALWGPAADVLEVLAGRKEPGELEVDEGLFDACTRSAVFGTEREVLRRSGKATDGVVSRNLNRPVSRLVSHALLRLGLTPAHASVLSLAVGLTAAWFATQTGHMAFIIAGIAFQAASIFDGVDGEMARVTFSESAHGAKLDTFFDHVTYVACLGGFVVGWMRAGIGAFGVALCVFVVIGVAATLLQCSLFIRRYAPDASFVFLDTCVRRAARENDTLSLRVMSGMFSAFRRDVFALLFMVVALTGSREAIVGLLALGVVLSNYTLIAHREDLIEAAVADEPTGVPSAAMG